MRHRRSRLRLKQKPAHARMLERNLVTSLLLYESLRTTRKRAKVIQPMVDKLISYAKTHEPQIAIRHINKVVTDRNASKKIMEVYCDRYKNRTSGLSRIKAAGVRPGDGAEVVDITLVDAVIGMQTATEDAKPAKKAAPKKEEAKATDADDKADKPKAAAKKPAAKKAPTKKKAS